MLKELVSIIIPAYNVEAYLEECLSSVVNQTYQNIEIILINDGSTDNTDNLCSEWENKDSRIRYISKINEGLGATRNTGIKCSRGKYLFFLDSDDWIKENAVEKLVKIAERSDADVIAPEYAEVDNTTKVIKEIHRSLQINELIESELERNIYLQYGVVMVWGKLYRREFLVSNNLYMPSIPHEDNAIFPMVVFLANRIICCNQTIYYYRINREGSIVSDCRSRLYLIDACTYFMNYYSLHVIKKEYYSSLKRYSETRIKFAYDLLNEKLGNGFVMEHFVPKMNLFFNKYFSNTKRLWEYRFLVFGSFSSRWIVQHIGMNIEQLENHMPFSSLIAQMTESINSRTIIKNQNGFRKEAVDKDYLGHLKRLLLENKDKPDFFIIDFLEERYDIVQLENGNYMTCSEPYYESEISGINSMGIIKAGSEEHMELWKKSCNEFVTKLKGYIDFKKIILLRSRLALKYYDGKEYVYYNNLHKLNDLNNMFEFMEKYFIDRMGDPINSYDLPQDVDLYTSNNKYGVMPEYWNHAVYKKMIAKMRVTFDRE